MSNDVNINNLQSVSGAENQPVILVDGVAYPVGLRVTKDLSFITAVDSDILKGKVGADKDGNPVVGTLEFAAEDVEFGYLTSDGNFQAIDLSVSPPVNVGAAVEAQLVYFSLPADPYLSISSAGLTEYNAVYAMQTVDEEIYPDVYMTCFSGSSGRVEFDITINRWVLRKYSGQPIDYQAVVTGIDGLTGQWEAVSDAAVEAVSVPVLTKLTDFELPEWNPQEVEI